MRRVFILAGTNKQAEDYAKANGLWPHRFFHVTSLEHLRGHNDFIFVKVGTWMINNRVSELVKIAESRRPFAILTEDDNLEEYLGRN